MTPLRPDRPDDPTLTATSGASPHAANLHRPLGSSNVGSAGIGATNVQASNGHALADAGALGPRRAPIWQYLLEGSGFTLLRLATDFLCALLAAFLTKLWCDGAGLPNHTQQLVWALPILCIGSLAVRGMYRRRVRVVILDGIGPVFGAVAFACMVLLLGAMVLAPHHQDTGELAGRAWIVSTVLIGVGRIAVAGAQRQARAFGVIGKPTLIVGAGRVGQQVARRIEEHPQYGLRPVGFLDAQPPQLAFGRRHRDAPVLGTPDELEHWVAVTGCEHVILAFSNAPDEGLTALVRRCEELGLEVSLVPRLFEAITDRVALDRLGGLPLLGLRSIDPKGWQFRFKYAGDRVFAGLALLAVGPLMLALALAVRMSSPGPILFRQRRVGIDGQVFDLLKFRSMRPLDPKDAGFVPKEGSAPGGVEGVDRRTRIGTFLRRSSLDELPQLLNVLNGDMSMIGPRPERPEFVELFRQDIVRYADRHRVKSGITGWAQVHGLRGQTSLADRVEWDNFYIENWSLWLDAKILLLTFGAVLRPSE